MEFIECKAKEEKKARVPDRKGRLRVELQRRSLQLDHVPEREPLGPRHRRLHASRRDERSIGRRTGSPTRSSPARPTRPARCMDRMAECAWHCGDPGVQYDTTINRWHTCPNSGRINASNPCCEYMFLDDTACNLASINLMKFRKADGTFDVERFQAACRIFFIAQEILVDHASYPTRDIAREQPPVPPARPGLLEPRQPAHDERHAVRLATPARGVCGAVTALLHGAANLTSAELAAAVGPFDGYDEESRADAPRHADASRRGRRDRPEPARTYLQDAARNVWDEVLAAGRDARLPQRAGHGARPDRHDQLHDGLRHHGHRARYRPGEVQAAGRRRHAQDRQPDRARSRSQTLGLRSAADRIDPGLHRRARHDRRRARSEGRAPAGVRLCVPAAQRQALDRLAGPRPDDGRRPAVPLGRDLARRSTCRATPRRADIAEAYLEGWKLGLKALAIYRDGSKESQPLSTSTEGRQAPRPSWSPSPRRERLPDTRQSITHKFSVAGHEGYITVGLYRRRPPRRAVHHDGQGRQHDRRPDGLLRHRGLDEPAIRRAARSATCDKFSHMRFEPMGHTKNPDIRIAKSLVDYIFRWLGITFLPGYKEASLGVLPEQRQVRRLGETRIRHRLGQRSAGQATNPTSSPARRCPANRSSAGRPQYKLASRQPTGPTALPKVRRPRKPPPSRRPQGQRSRSKRQRTREGRDRRQRPGPGPRRRHVQRRRGPNTARSEQFADFQSDAPACDNCGAITVRNGNCYLCHNCGSSMGCS